MSEHNETLQKTLEEVTRLRSEREESLREVAASEFSGRLRYAERIYWLYGVACVAVGVAAINFFVRSFDIKMLIGCAVVLLVIYETTVLAKLWFATAKMKMDTLKEMKMLRLEVARLGTAVGVDQPPRPPVKYEPMPGMPRWERGFWLAACVLVAMVVSSWTAHAWFGGGDYSTETLVTLAADGSAEKQKETERGYTGYYLPKGFSLYTPKGTKVRFLDPTGHEMPVQLVVTGTNNRHDVTFTNSVFDQGKMRYTQIWDVPRAAKLEDGVWTYQDGIHHVGRDTKYDIAVLLPPDARLLSTDPTAEVEQRKDGRTHVRFKGTAKDDTKYTFTIRYELPATSEQYE
jgi:hypothetical protein